MRLDCESDCTDHAVLFFTCSACELTALCIIIIAGFFMIWSHEFHVTGQVTILAIVVNLLVDSLNPRLLIVFHRYLYCFCLLEIFYFKHGSYVLAMSFYISSHGIILFVSKSLFLSWLFSMKQFLNWSEYFISKSVLIRSVITNAWKVIETH